MLGSSALAARTAGLILGAGALVAAGVTPGAGAAPGRAASARPVYRIGFEGPLSGPYAQLGINAVNGAALAIRRANADGSLPFRLVLVREDDEGEPAVAPAAAQALIVSSVRAVIGPSFSGATQAVGARYAQAHLAMVSPSASNPSLAHQGWSTFHRVVPDDYVEGVQAANWLHRLGRTRLFVVQDRSPYGAGLGRTVTRVARAAGMHVTEVARDGATTTNYRPLARRIAASGIHTLFYAGYDAQAAQLAHALVHAGFHGMRVSGNGVYDSTFTRLAGAAGHGWYATCGCMSRYRTPAERAFAHTYRRVYNEAPGTYSAQGYDAANATIQALRKAIADGSHSRPAVNAALRRVSFAGISTHVAFAANGDIARRVARVNLFQDRSGRFVEVGNLRRLP